MAVDRKSLPFGTIPTSETSFGMQSFFAIFAGFITVPTLGLVCGHFLRKYVSPGSGNLVAPEYAMTSVLLSQLANIAGGFVTGVLAPKRKLLHAVILGLLGFVIGIWVAIEDWNQTPIWYHFTEIGLIFPVTVAGGWLASRRRESHEQA